MKIVKNSTENCNFYSHEKSLYFAWACFRNVSLIITKPELSWCWNAGIMFYTLKPAAEYITGNYVIGYVFFVFSYIY